MKYTGPAKPVPTYREPISDRALALWFVVLAVFLLAFILLE